MRKAYEGFLGQITKANTLDLLANFVDRELKAVVPVEIEYFSDRTPASIIDGQFVVLGKVVRNIPEGGGSINLLRGTGLERLSAKQLEPLYQAFSQIEQVEFPKLITHIEGPVIQIVPIAIYI
ncbi:MAG: hypothetical protein M5R40_27565 [Anaerolineae bacterium]|nr:hypothetical protein [Anaerolineae bacterium]